MAEREDGRLDSWKEVADYLRRDIRTVIRWEKDKGLPVHTFPGGKRRSVYAYRHEIEEWLGKSASVVEGADLPAPGALERIGLFWGRIPVVARAGLGILVLGLAGVSMYVLKESQSPVLTTLLQEGNRLVAISPNSSVAWRFEFPFESARITQSIVVPQGDGRGAAGVLVSINAGEGRGDRLYFFSPKGQPLWQFQPHDLTAFGAGEYSLQWGFDSAQVFRWGGQTKIVVAAHHFSWWPSQVLVLNLQGRVLERFVNSGWITHIVFMEGTNGPFLLLGGVSNSGDGGMTALLDANRISGSSPEEVGSAYECKNCPPGRPLKYLVFPRSELNRVTGSPVFGAGGAPRGDVIIVSNKEVQGAPGTGDPAATYEFSPNLNLVRAQYSDRYWEYHRQLELEGRIKHSKAQCRDRFGPRLVRAWDPEHGWRQLHASKP